jgi:hypothetical protein
MFPWKSITKIWIPTFAKSNKKVGVGILLTGFQGNILMHSDGFENETVWHSNSSVTWTNPFSLQDKENYCLLQSKRSTNKTLYEVL